MAKSRIDVAEVLRATEYNWLNSKLDVHGGRLVATLFEWGTTVTTRSVLLAR